MSDSGATITLFLAGDVMTGRGIDQILPHPCPPRLYEPVVRSALEYVELAERAHGPIRWPVSYSYVWGAALEELARRAPLARIVNLETSVTRSEKAAPKGINYRMNPDNVGVLSVAAIDCALLANNHVLDWGTDGLLETLDTLTRAGIAHTGAGRTIAEAQAPVVIPLGDAQRLLVFAFGAVDSGVPVAWSAGTSAPGVNWLRDFSSDSAERVARTIATTKVPGDLVIASIHWGGNWGFDIPDAHRHFAHELIDHAGVDLVHGHSSHHPKAIEVYGGRAILYGCGDFINDYEGIPGHLDYRADLPLMYFPELDRATGALRSLEMLPLFMRNMRLRHPGAADVRWLRDMMDRECRRFGRRVIERDGRLILVSESPTDARDR